MAERRRRVYVDTSVFGGAFDVEFESATRTFLEQARAGQFALVASPVVRDEIAGAPDPVRELFAELSVLVEIVDPTEEAVQLQAAYLKAGIITPKWAADALQVAVAVVSGCSAIVSWNFRHIVHSQKVPLYNAVSLSEGYAAITICSPPEVVRYDEDEEAV